MPNCSCMMWNVAKSSWRKARRYATTSRITRTAPKNSQVEQITKAFDVDGALLNEMMRLDLTETTLNEFGRFDRLKASVNRSLAKAFFDKPDSPVSQFTANLLATKLLKSFILEGGFDLDDRK